MMKWIASFIEAIADISLDTLRIGRTRSSTSQEVPEDIDSELRSAMESVNTNVDQVIAQVDTLIQATATYNILNPAVEEAQPHTRDQDTDQPQVPHRHT